MPITAHGTESVSSRPGEFARTQWSVVLTAGQSDSPQARGALEKLCRTYWPPIYAFVRRQGHSPHDAQDLTQEFFARLLEKKSLTDVDRAKGRFRSFLLAALKNFLANEWDKASAKKRGGGQVLIPMDARTGESSYVIEPPENITAEKLYERRWALTLLDLVLQKLRDEYVRGGKERFFDHLKVTLTEASRSVPYADLGRQLSLSEGAVKVAVHRLRRRYRDLLRAEIAETVAEPGEVEDEIRNLFAALAS